jgi:hypothetical protein
MIGQIVPIGGGKWVDCWRICDPSLGWVGSASRTPEMTISIRTYGRVA